MSRWSAVILCAAALCAASPGYAVERSLYFDVEDRRRALQTPSMSTVRDACHALHITLPPLQEGFPEALTATPGYGASKEVHAAAWHMMVLGGRALAGDQNATQALITLFDQLATQQAYVKTVPDHDTYYALKRSALPMLVSYGIIVDQLNDFQKERMNGWFTELIPPLDYRFGGDVDHNNHRLMTEAILLAYGVMFEDQALVDKTLTNVHRLLVHIDEQGFLPLEARRGARALWYQRHAISSLSVIAKIASFHELDIDINGPLDRLAATLRHGMQSPEKVMADARWDKRSGTKQPFTEQAFGFLEPRPHGRHYMAWLELYLHQGQRFTQARWKAYFDARTTHERPLIDEYVGGNATCFLAKRGGDE